MRTKGSALIPMVEFIKKSQGKDGFNKWLETLDPEAREVLNGNILSSGWHDLKKFMIDPTMTYCKLFTGGNIKGAWDLGRFSADYGLKGIFKVFVKFGSPQFIINRAGTILPKYYENSAIKTEKSGDKEVIIQITRFDGIDPVVEARIGGWMERALEICGCSNVKIETMKSMCSGAPTTDFKASWS